MSPGPGAESFNTRQLDTYRDRYDIENRLGPIKELRKSLARRQVRRLYLTRRSEELKRDLLAVKAELTAVQSEIDGTLKTSDLLIEDLLDQVRIDHGEGWSPLPVLGFRAWSITNGAMKGIKVVWHSPTLRSECLNSVPGQDVPHSLDRCGPPPCGIYATKDLGELRGALRLRPETEAVLGVVALTGKVIEHEHGYRGFMARALALAVFDGKSSFTTDDPGTIDAMFCDPTATLAEIPTQARRSIETGDSFLTSWKENNQWKWETSSESSR